MFPISVIATIAIVVLFTSFTALIDAEMILKRHYIDSHKTRWLQRFMFFLAVGVENHIYSIAAALIFSALFDQILNMMRGKPFWYLGTVAKWDIFWSKFKIGYIVMKILILIAGISLFFVNLSKF